MLWLLFICMLTVSYCLNSWLPTLLVKVGRTAEFGSRQSLVVETAPEKSLYQA